MRHNMQNNVKEGDPMITTHYCIVGLGGIKKILIFLVIKEVLRTLPRNKFRSLDNTHVVYQPLDWTGGHKYNKI